MLDNREGEVAILTTLPSLLVVLAGPVGPPLAWTAQGALEKIVVGAEKGAASVARASKLAADMKSGLRLPLLTKKEKSSPEQ